MFGSYHRFFEDVSSNIRGRSFMHARCISLRVFTSVARPLIFVEAARRGVPNEPPPPLPRGVGLHGLLASAAPAGRSRIGIRRSGMVRPPRSGETEDKLFYRAGILFAIMSRGTHTSITAVAWKRRMQAGWRGKEQLAAPPPLAALPQRACCKQPHGGACPDPRCARTT
jgi:hypothetical protein